jgi:hypothetical protein
VLKIILFKLQNLAQAGHTANTTTSVEKSPEISVYFCHFRKKLPEENYRPTGEVIGPLANDGGGTWIPTKRFFPRKSESVGDVAVRLERCEGYLGPMYIMIFKY